MADAPAAPKNPRDYSDLLETNNTDAFAFSDREKLVLGLYHQLTELELQRSLLEAQNEADVPDFSQLSDHEVQEQLAIAEREAMDARVELELRNRITRNVLVMDPVLKAVYGGEITDYAEKRILPLILENDTLNMVHGHLCSKLNTLANAISAAERGNMAANGRNRELSKTMLAFTDDMKSRTTADIEDPQLREKVNAVEKELKESRRRMVNLKSILSGMIVGSGVNWAEDEVLRELVMDDEDEG